MSEVRAHLELILKNWLDVAESVKGLIDEADRARKEDEKACEKEEVLRRQLIDAALDLLDSPYWPGKNRASAILVAMENAGRALVEEVKKERAASKEEPGQENVGRVVPVRSGNAPKPPARPGKPKP